MQTQSEAERLRKKVKEIHRTDLHLLDGEGTLEKPFIIDPTMPLGDYTQVENDTIAFRFLYGGYAGWKNKGQKLVIHRGRTLDEISMEICFLDGDGIVASTRSIYFDITPFLEVLDTKEEDPTGIMKKMKEFLDRLNEETDKK